MRNLGVIMPGCVVQQTEISRLRKMNMMTFTVVQSITFLPSLTMFYFKIKLKLNAYVVIILSSVGEKLKQHSESDTASHSREELYFFNSFKKYLFIWLQQVLVVACRRIDFLTKD